MAFFVHLVHVKLVIILLSKTNSSFNHFTKCNRNNLVHTGIDIFKRACVSVCVCVTVCVSQQNDGVKSASASPIKLNSCIQSYRVLMTLIDYQHLNHSSLHQTILNAIFVFLGPHIHPQVHMTIERWAIYCS